MAHGGFGLSFAPGQAGPTRERGINGGAPSPIQQAIQLLSLRLPRVMGAQALAPGPLMQAPGAGAMGGGGSVDALLRLLFGMGGPDGLAAGGLMPRPAPPGMAGFQAPPMRPSAPSPRIGAGIRGPVIPGQRPGVPPLPNAGGWPEPGAAPMLPTPTYTPAPGRPSGWGNVPDNWRPWGSAGPTGFGGGGR